MVGWLLCILWGLGALAVCLFAGTKASFLLLCASLLLPGIGLLTAFCVSRGLKTTLHLPSATPKNETISGELQFVNRFPFPILRAVLRLELTNLLTRETLVLPLTFSLLPLGRTSVPFSFQSAHCGRLLFRCTEIRIYDLLGLFPMKKKLELEEKRMVAPEIFPIHVQLLGSEHPAGGEDALHFHRKGQDWSEPFQIRAYQEGDSLKRIHWKLSQKLDRYLVLDPSQTLDRALLVFWDQGVLTSDTPPEVTDALAESVLSLCLALVQAEIPYTVAWGSGDVELMDISSLESLYALLPHLFSLPSEQAGASQIPACLQTLGERRYPLWAYFGSSGSADFSLLSQAGKVTAFLCSMEGDLAVTEVLSQPFSPSDYRQSLCEILL